VRKPKLQNKAWKMQKINTRETHFPWYYLGALGSGQGVLLQKRHYKQFHPNSGPSYIYKMSKPGLWTVIY
jgi:hypothetical protein